MIDQFYMNNVLWRINKVDPYSKKLVDRTGTLTVATTDPITHTVNIAKTLKGNFYNTVLIHEFAHCAMISYNMLEYIHDRVPREYWVDIEEFICNFLADYGLKIFQIVRRVQGDNAIKIIPMELEKYIA